MLKLALRHQTAPLSPTRAMRGAAATEYALLLAMFTLVVIAGVRLLQSSSEELLTDTGTGIGDARPLRAQVLTDPVAPPPQWVSTTLPPQILTYVDKPVETAAGCLALVEGKLSTSDCGDAAVALVSALSTDGETLTISMEAETLCLTADLAVSPPVAQASPCGPGQQLWTEIAGVGTNVHYVERDSGLCLDATSTPPPAPEPDPDPAAPDPAAPDPAPAPEPAPAVDPAPVAGASPFTLSPCAAVVGQELKVHY